MRVPTGVRAVFDQFPLVTLPEHIEKKPNHKLDKPLLAVYNLDQDNLPLEPKCLATVTLLRMKDIAFTMEKCSPYISSLETLPLLINDTEKAVYSTLDQVLDKYFSQEAQDPTFIVYRSLIETWLDDAWHNTVMDPVHTAAKERVFDSQDDDKAPFPWPFTRIKQSQLDAHLEERYVKARAAIHDDYVCSDGNLLRTGLTLNALDEVVSVPVEKPTILDIFIFSYILPITQLLPDSALAALITPKLHAHAQSIRQYLTR